MFFIKIRAIGLLKKYYIRATGTIVIRIFLNSKPVIMETAAKNKGNTVITPTNKSTCTTSSLLVMDIVDAILCHMACN